MAYLYIRATDAWQAVGDELRLRPNYDQEIGEVFFAVDLLIRKDTLIQAFAFTRSEAKDYIEKQSGISKIQILSDEINVIRAD